MSQFNDDLEMAVARVSDASDGLVEHLLDEGNSVVYAAAVGIQTLVQQLQTVMYSHMEDVSHEKHSTSNNTQPRPLPVPDGIQDAQIWGRNLLKTIRAISSTDGDEAELRASLFSLFRLADQVMTDLDQGVDELMSRSAAPGPVGSSNDAVIEKLSKVADSLAIKGNNADSLAILESSIAMLKGQGSDPAEK